MLLLDWLQSGRSLDALGLAAPTSLPSKIGLGLAAALLLTLVFVGRAKAKTPDAPRAESRDILPTTKTEFFVFSVFALVVGASWEVLFRGYLVWALKPRLGLAAAVILAAGAYGLAHGFKTIRSFAASMVSALIFTVAYVTTGSLWWLIIIHAALPLFGAVFANTQKYGQPTPAASL